MDETRLVASCSETRPHKSASHLPDKSPTQAIVPGDLMNGLMNRDCPRFPIPDYPPIPRADPRPVPSFGAPVPPSALLARAYSLCVTSLCVTVPDCKPDCILG